MSRQLIGKVVVAGRDAPLWLAASVLRKALRHADVHIEAVELPSLLGTADICPTLPALEAFHNQLGIDEAALLRTTQGSFTLGQNFVDHSGNTPAFLNAYGSYGASIGGKDFFPYWLKARRYGLNVGLEDFSLTASAARQGRIFIPDDESEAYGRSDYGYHLPAVAYARILKAAAIHLGVVAHEAETFEVVRDSEYGALVALALDTGQHIEGDLFIDATGPEALLIRGALGVDKESWRAHFPVDRVLTASGPKFESVPVYAEVRAWDRGWTALFPSQMHTHVIHAYASEHSSDEEALRDAEKVSHLPLASMAVRTSSPGLRAAFWQRNCIAIGEAGCTFDPVFGVDLHALQLGLVSLLACFPAGEAMDFSRDEYNRVMRSSCERVRDFQSAHYALNRYGASSFWTQAREAPVSSTLAQSIALFRARGEIAPFEEESFSPDSWRALYTGHGIVPDTYLPTIDHVSPDEMKAQFRRMLGIVREQVLRQPIHDEYLGAIRQHAHG